MDISNKRLNLSMQLSKDIITIRDSVTISQLVTIQERIFNIVEEGFLTK